MVASGLAAKSWHRHRPARAARGLLAARLVRGRAHADRRERLLDSRRRLRLAHRARRPDVSAPPRPARRIPNDPCCQSCGESEHRTPVALRFRKTPSARRAQRWTAADDDLNLRCFEQKARFGFDLLYPTARYVSGFGDGAVPNRAGVAGAQSLCSIATARTAIARCSRWPSSPACRGKTWPRPQPDLGTRLEFLDGPEACAAATLAAPGRRSKPLLATDRSVHARVGRALVGKNPITQASIVRQRLGRPARPTPSTATSRRRLVGICSTPARSCCPSPWPATPPRPRLARAATATTELTSNRPSAIPRRRRRRTTQYLRQSYPALRELTGRTRARSPHGARLRVRQQHARRHASDYGYRPVFGAIGRRFAATQSRGHSGDRWGVDARAR